MGKYKLRGSKFTKRITWGETKATKTNNSTVFCIYSTLYDISCLSLGEQNEHTYTYLNLFTRYIRLGNNNLMIFRNKLRN